MLLLFIFFFVDVLLRCCVHANKRRQPEINKRVRLRLRMWFFVAIAIIRIVVAFCRIFMEMSEYAA